MNVYAQIVAGITGFADKVAGMIRESQWKQAGKDELLLQQQKERDKTRAIMKHAKADSKDLMNREKLRERFGKK